MTRAAEVTAIAFDLDGTLIDTGVVVPDAYMAVVDKLGGVVQTREQVIAAYRAGATAAVLAQLLGREPPPDAVPLYLTELEVRAHGVSVYSGMLPTLERLADRWPLGVYSGASAAACAILLERTGLREFFAAVVGGDEVECPKPDPQGLLALGERLGVATSEMAYVGDSLRDAGAARACGALAVAAAWGHEYSPTDLGAVVVASPGELLGVFGPG